ncbi:hypothetical protein G7Z17_g738 [Cylindrodendrum hubeiense]|uniref:Zn(2)-C6 fungal-type domain-containing protein n=1 Tax=Cylindrodendrum hubeiense TaxID=595255 RepID=A0A9P5HG88_9HYPO|nr:hypothetical protein G7Z17_g738 [Cylindrodendrum hubeiense]
MAQDQDSSNKPPRRGGGKRTPLSCLACRQHKLRCDRRVPCGTCIHYRREAQCHENPAPPRRRAAASAQQEIGEQSSSTGIAIYNGYDLQGHALQVHALQGHALQARELAVSTARSEHAEHLGQAVRNAQAIGLDRDTTPSTCLEEEMRHRIWWDLVDADT